MKNTRAIATTTLGSILSALGGLGAACSICAPACCAVAISGPLVAIFGVGVATFFYKYSVVFIILGGVQVLYGLYLFARYIRRRKREA